jgi:hypothetical protein
MTGPWQQINHILRQIHKAATDDTNPSPLPSIPRLEQEGLQDDKPNTPEHHQTIPKYILQAHNRPTYHIPDLVRVVGYTVRPMANSSKTQYSEEEDNYNYSLSAHNPHMETHKWS